MGVEHLTFDQYLEANAASQRSRAGKLAFDQLQLALDDLPATRSRLALEMVKAGLKYVAERAEIGPLSSWIRQWSRYVEAGEMVQFVDLVETLTIQYFNSFEEFEISFPEVVLPVLLSTIWDNQPGRLEPLLRHLRSDALSGKRPIKIQILEEFEQKRK